MFRRTPRGLLPKIEGYTPALAARSDKIEFNFLNSNLIGADTRAITFNHDTFPMMEKHMFGESTQILLFLAIVGLTLVSTIDLVMQPIKQERNTDQNR
jgi:hypothetical protein